MANYLDETIYSWHVQKMQELEIIYINDGSTDSSLDIIRTWQKKDPRIKIISFRENSGTWNARIEGVKAARGQYIMFADADDSISSDACDVLYKLIRHHAVDILHFRTHVMNVNHMSRDTIASVKDFVKPYCRKLKGEDVLTACFEKDKYHFSLWNKVYSADICKKAFSEMPYRRMCMAEDKLAYFMLAYYSRSYVGVKTRVCYNYYYGRGGFGKTDITTDCFEKYCSGGLAAEQLRIFLKRHDENEKYIKIEKKFRRELLENCLWRFLENVKRKDQPQCFDLMQKYFRTDEIVSAIREHAEDKAYSLAKSLKNSKSIQFDKRDIKTIGTYYYSIMNGGLEKVLCTLAKIWTEMGYKVVVITDTAPDKKDYELPENVERVIIPGCMWRDPEQYKKHAKALYHTIIEKKIDLFVYHAWVGRNIFWDELIIKSAGAAFIPHCHNAFGFLFQQAWPRMQNTIAAYLIADGVVVLSEMDKTFWNNFNNNVFLVQNPFFETPDRWTVSDCNSHDIVWVGRLSEEKNPEELLQIINLVRNTVPDAKLNIVGEGDPKYVSEIRDTIEHLGLQTHVLLHGFHKDVKPFYQSASVFLLTSDYEGFPLALQESMLAGIPTVMYELPYLTLVINNPAIRSVAQHDVYAASEELSMLLTDDKCRKKMGEQARLFIEELYRYDYEDVWKKIFSSTQEEHQNISKREHLMMKYIISNHNDFSRKYNEGIRYSKRKGARAAFAVLKALDIYRENGRKYFIKKGIKKIKNQFRK